MAIFWGMGAKSKNYDGLWVPYFCPVCEEISSFAVTENYRYGQVYGIRIAKYKAKFFLVCHECDRLIQIENTSQFSAAQEIARKIATEDFETKSVIEYVADIARFVFDNQELADLLLNEEKLRENLPESLEYSHPALVDESRSTTESDENKICPDCAETIKEAARKCRFCNYTYE